MSDQLKKGTTIYARRAGNKHRAWYVIDRPVDWDGTTALSCWAHVEHGAGRSKYMTFFDVKHIDPRYVEVAR